MPAPDAPSLNGGGLPTLRRSHDTVSINSNAASSTSVLTNNNVNGSSAINAVASALYAELEGLDVGQQLQLLYDRLTLQTRIKEGAEDVLKSQPMKDTFRAKVTAELDTAKRYIEVISRRIEQLSIRPSRSKASLRSHTSPVNSKRNPPSEPPGQAEVRPAGLPAIDRDDLREQLRSISHLTKALAMLNVQTLSPTTSSPSSSSGPPPPATDYERDKMRFGVMGKLTEALARLGLHRYEVNIPEVIDATLPCLADNCIKEIRTAAYRLLRHVVVDAMIVAHLQQKGLDWYLVKTLSRDIKYIMEREQAFKLIRAFVEFGSERRPHTPSLGSVPLSESVMRAIIAVAEQPDDPHRMIGLLCLIEILMIDLPTLMRFGAMRVLLTTLSDPSTEHGAALLSTVFLFLIDCPGTRSYFQPGTDLEGSLAGITDAYGKGSDHLGKMRASVKATIVMLRTWSGLMYFCLDNMRAIRTVVDTLRIPSLDTREVILDMFFELLNIKTPDWFQTFIEGRRLTMYRRSRNDAKRQSLEPPSKAQEPSVRITDQYMGMLVLVLAQAGLMDALTAMVEESLTGSSLTRKATLLMGEVLQLANRVLPLSIAARIQAMPRVFNLAADYDNGENRIVGTSALSAFDSLNRNRARLQRAAPAPDNRQRSNSVEDPVRRGQRQVEQAKTKMLLMDDKSFATGLLETQVMITKDHTQWSFEKLQELVDTHFQSTKRVEEAIKASRFMRRLVAFFHPFNHRFSDIERNSVSVRWVRLGCNLLTALIQSTEGQKYLSTEDDLLRQIVKGFAQLDPFNNSPEHDPIFSKARMEGTLTYGYFEMLGTLSKFKEGVELLEQFKVFTAFYHLSELRSREDLIKNIIENIDYTIDGHPRIVLSKALTSSYKHIRLYATNHLGQLVRSSPKAAVWSLRLLLTQLYDPAPEVVDMTVHFLEEACESSDALQLIVEMQPTLDHLGELGHPLLLKFMSTPLGFRYLCQADYIDREMSMWYNERNLYYVVQIELYLARALQIYPLDDEDEAVENIPPPHFYGEMAKTPHGCEILLDRGHFTDFATFIREHGLESEDAETIMKLKSLLWAVGNIGATEGGVAFLEDEEVVPVIVEIAEQSSVASVRGTCFFVLGLIASTIQGAEILEDFGWEATMSPVGTPTGIAVPTDLSKFISLPPWEPFTVREEEVLLHPTASQLEEDVMTAVSNLANSVIANQASRTLARLKSRPESRHIFSSCPVFYRVLHAISSQRYRLPVRRFILDLFDIELSTETIRALSESASELAVPTVPKPAPNTRRGRLARVVSVIGRPAHGRWGDSDEEESLNSEEEEVEVVPSEKPVINLRPQSTIRGFTRIHESK